MAKIIETREFTISSHYAPALEYGDESGLDVYDTAALFGFNNVELTLPEGANHWVFDYGAAQRFAVCDVCGLGADCITLTATALG